MDASAIVAALQWGATAIAEGVLSEAGKNIYKSLRKEMEAIVPSGDIDGLQASLDAQKSARVLAERAATASEGAQRHLDTLAYEILSLREKHKIAQRDTKVDVIVERVFELFERHSIDRPTMAEILGVSLSTLKGHGLVDHLDNRKLDELAATFAVSRGWLLGEYNSPAICVCRWYKSAATAMRNLVQLLRAEKQPTIHFVKSRSMNALEVVREGAQSASDKFMQEPVSTAVAVVTALTHRTPAGRTYKSYQRWESVPWDHEPARIDLLTLVMFCERNLIALRGIPDLNDNAKEVESRLKRMMLYTSKFHSHAWEVEDEVLKDYERGVSTPRELVSHNHRSGWFIGDYVDLPEWSTAAKANPGEYKYIQERYELILVGLGRDQNFKELLSSV